MTSASAVVGDAYRSATARRTETLRIGTEVESPPSVARGGDEVREARRQLPGDGHHRLADDLANHAIRQTRPSARDVARTTFHTVTSTTSLDRCEVRESRWISRK